MNLRHMHSESRLFVFTFNSSERGLELMLEFTVKTVTPPLPITGNIGKKSYGLDVSRTEFQD